MKARIVLLALALAMIPSFAFAQASGTGSVVGRVADSSGAVLPGVTGTPLPQLSSARQQHASYTGAFRSRVAV